MNLRPETLAALKALCPTWEENKARAEGLFQKTYAELLAKASPSIVSAVEKMFLSGYQAASTDHLIRANRVVDAMLKENA